MNITRTSMQNVFAMTAVMIAVVFAVISFGTKTISATPEITTRNASNITTNSATLVGRLDSTGGGSVWLSFEYGERQSPSCSMGDLGRGVSAGASITTAQTFEQTVTGLKSGTWYCFRAKVFPYPDTSEGSVSGEILSFQTLSDTPTYQTQTQVPQMSVGNVTGITDTQVMVSGNITNTGGETVARSFEYGVRKGYSCTASDMERTVTAGSSNSTSSFSQMIMGLSPNTTYCFRAKGENSAGTGYSGFGTFTTTQSNTNTNDPWGGNTNTSQSMYVPEVFTSLPTNIAEYSATLNGYLNSTGGATTTRKFSYGKKTWSVCSFSDLTQNVTVDSTDWEGSYQKSVSGLSPNTTYCFQAVAENKVGTDRGEILEFTTKNEIIIIVDTTKAPDVETDTPTNITKTSATLNGSLFDTGGLTTNRWFKWGLRGNDNVCSDSDLGSTSSVGNTNSTGSFNSSLSGLSNDTWYCYRAYAQNGKGSDVGVMKQFKTDSMPIIIVDTTRAPDVETNSATSVTKTSATLQGVLLDTGELSTNRWFKWGLRGNDNVCSDSDLAYTESVGSTNGTGLFSQSISGLSQNTWYCFQAHAQNSKGSDKGIIRQFVTDSMIVVQNDRPQVETRPATSVSKERGTLQGTLLSTGGETTSRSFDWGRSNNNSSCSSSDLYHVESVGSTNTTGEFSREISGLTKNTLYCFRAVASNTQGVVYGIVRSFRTDDDTTTNNPDRDIQIETRSPKDVERDQAELRGNVEDEGWGDVEVWFEFDRNSSDVRNGDGEVIHVNGTFDDGDSFSKIVRNLRSGTRYYYRACGEDRKGDEDCGSVESFITDDGNIITHPVNDDLRAQTRLAILPSATTVTLSGSFDRDRVCGTNVFFEYGRTPSLGQRSSSVVRNAPHDIVNTLVVSLNPNSTYFYRVVAEGCGEVAFGDILSFQTKPTSTYVTPVTPKPKPKSPSKPKPEEKKEEVCGCTHDFAIGSSLIFLDITDRTSDVRRGDSVVYEVIWHNLSKQTLEDVQLEIELSHDTTLVAKTNGSYNDRDSVLFWNIGVVNAEESGNMTFEIEIDGDVSVGDVILTQATLVYRNPLNFTSESTLAFDADEVIGGRQTASASDSNKGLGAFGIILFILIIIVAFLLGFLLSRKKDDEDDDNDFSRSAQGHGETPRPTESGYYQSSPIYDPNMRNQYAARG